MMFLYDGPRWREYSFASAKEAVSFIRYWKGGKLRTIGNEFIVKI